MSEEIKISLVDSNGHVYGDMDGNADYGQISFDFETNPPMDFTFNVDPVTFTIDIPVNYAFDEGNLLEEIKTYIDSTYDAHYSQGKYQATQIIEDCGHGMGFALGNVLKYCQRYGKKEGLNRADLLKVIHYGIIALAMHDRSTDQQAGYLELFPIYHLSGLQGSQVRV